MARTRTKKNAKYNPVIGRKSNTIIATKNPIISRKHVKSQTQKNTNRRIKALLYESPLTHLHHNGEQSNTQIRFEETRVKELENLPQRDQVILKITPNPEVECNGVANIYEKGIAATTIGYSETKREESNSLAFVYSNVEVSAQRTLKKSPLYTIGEIIQPPSVNPSDGLDESVICVDDLDVDSDYDYSAKLRVNTEDMVVLDEDPIPVSSETCYQTVSKQVNVAENLLDSVIILDDEPPPFTNTASTKSTEDCMVVWSSLPKVPTTLTLSKRNENDDVLKSDKILLDTRDEPSNCRYLKNDHSNKQLAKKSSKVTKFGVKKLSTKKVAEMTNGLTKTKNASKIVPKTIEVATKKRNKGELIFSAQHSETKGLKKSDNDKQKKGMLREIVIDGSNAAMAYTNNKVFSEKGIKMLIDYFSKKGHTVKVFVPQYRRARHYPLLEKWYNEGIVVFTPSRKLGNKSITSYDDRYILEYATACKGIVVSQDQFRDLYAEKIEYRETIEKRLLIPTFVGDYVMFPEDPLGRNGPSLAEFLKH